MIMMLIIMIGVQILLTLGLMQLIQCQAPPVQREIRGRLRAQGPAGDPRGQIIKCTKHINKLDARGKMKKTQQNNKNIYQTNDTHIKQVNK